MLSLLVRSVLKIFSVILPPTPQIYSEVFLLLSGLKHRHLDLSIWIYIQATLVLGVNTGGERILYCFEVNFNSD